MASVSPDEPRYRIPRQFVLIPRHTSIQKMEPAYAFPILKAKFSPMLSDPADPVRVIPFPESIPADDRYLEVPQNGAVEWEAQRLRIEHGDDPKTRLSWFDRVYPTIDLFEVAFKNALRTARKVGGSFIDPKALAALVPLKGVDKLLGAKLIEHGFDSTEKIALASVDELLKIEGLGRARAEQVHAAALDDQEAKVFRTGEAAVADDSVPVVLEDEAEFAPPASGFDPLHMEAEIHAESKE